MNTRVSGFQCLHVLMVGSLVLLRLSLSACHGLFVDSHRVWETIRICWLVAPPIFSSVSNCPRLFRMSCINRVLHVFFKCVESLTKEILSLSHQKHPMKNSPTKSCVALHAPPFYDDHRMTPIFINSWHELSPMILVAHGIGHWLVCCVCCTGHSRRRRVWEVRSLHIQQWNRITEINIPISLMFSGQQKMAVQLKGGTVYRCDH